jgi:hypothetical protein
MRGVVHLLNGDADGALRIDYMLLFIRVGKTPLLFVLFKICHCRSLAPTYLPYSNARCVHGVMDPPAGEVFSYLPKMPPFIFFIPSLPI